MYWANENPCIEEKAVNVPGGTVWFGLSSKELIGPHFFKETVIDQTYLQMLKIKIPRLNDFTENKNEVYIQQVGAQYVFHANVRNFIDRTLNQISRFNTLELYLCGILKNTVYAIKHKHWRN